ncbi:PBP1A family penicillin-binding protein [Enterococcus canis]|uniref:PBP1A family penicillin-binding protein n=1 Tax=Enterococcus canis TaxID=214095 RepID=UPI0008334F5A|nr:PBP1A family penicillin-binding protein [Enterococcus canis]
MANEQSRATRSSRSQQSNKAPKPKGTGKKSVGKIILNIFLGLVALGCVAFLAGVGLFWFYAKDAPKISDKELESPASAQLYFADNSLMMDLGTETRVVVEPSEVPQQLEDAIVSVEDRRFYKHIGVDPIRIIGSALSNFTSGGLQGGSTLTQQLIKLSYFSTKEEDQTLKRKAQEAWMAIQLEKEKSKQEILTYYINKVYMANGYYGMETASEHYFGKKLSELDLPQTALLAGMPQAPNSYDPYAYPDQAKERRDIVLLTMKENDKISEDEYKKAVATPITDGLKKQSNSASDDRIYDNPVKEVIAEVQAAGHDPYTEGLKIYTTIDKDAQNHLYDVVNSDKYVNYPDDDLQIASTIVDVDTGAVVAQIGGRKIPEDVRFGQNLATNTLRDVGSTMKPMADYGPAFEYLHLSTAYRLDDAPFKYPDGTPLYNWDRQYYGNMTLRTALELSRNIPAAKLLEEVGLDDSAKFMKGLGIEFPTMQYSNAISSRYTGGDSDKKYGVSTERLAGAYSAFANGGTYHKPYYVKKIVFQDDTEQSFESKGERAMTDVTAYMITDILKGVITSGTGNNAAIDGLIQAGKTGTSDYGEDQEVDGEGVPDVSFVGYTRHYSVAVWAGYNKESRPITEAYQQIASDVYREAMTEMASKVSNDDWEMPNGVTRIGGELYQDGYNQIPQSSVSTPPSSTTESTTESTESTESSEESSESSSSTEESKEPESSTPPSSSSEPEPSSSSAPPESSTTPPSSSQPTEETQQSSAA